MGIFNSDSDKLKKAKKRMESIKRQLDVLTVEYDSAIKEYKSMAEEDAAAENRIPVEPEKAEANNENVLLQQIEKKDAQIADYVKQAADYEKRIDDLEAQISNLTSRPHESEPAEPSGAQNEGLQKTLDALEEKMTELTAQIGGEHQRLLKENSDIQEQLDRKQERLEQIIQNCQEDRYKKDKIKLVNKYIYQMDLIRKVLYDFDLLRTAQSDKDSVVFLENQLKSIVVGMEATLVQEMVEPVQYGEHGGVVDPEFQETIDTVATDDPELDGKIYSSINPGYVWTLPYILKAKITDKGDEIKSYRFLVRPEQIIIYRLNK